MGVKKAGWGYVSDTGCGELWVKSDRVEKVLKGKRTREGRVEVGNNRERENNGAGYLEGESEGRESPGFGDFRVRLMVRRMAA